VPAHPGGPGKRAVKWLWCGEVVDVCVCIDFQNVRLKLSLCGIQFLCIDNGSVVDCSVNFCKRETNLWGKSAQPFTC